MARMAPKKYFDAALSNVANAHPRLYEPRPQGSGVRRERFQGSAES
jgi:hypothetical protein